VFEHFKYPKSIAEEIDLLKKGGRSDLDGNATKRAIELFNYSLEHVPAYEKFLHEKGISLTPIVSYEEFKKIPPVDKSGYLKNYDYLDLLPDRVISNSTTISSTSGSTGEPFYFPRGEMQDRQYEYIAELFLNNQFDLSNKSTLGIIGYGLGIWIGGIFTYKNFNRIAAKGYKLTLAPTGTDKDIFIKTFNKVAKYYDQILLMGYPPFIKDVIDIGELEGINWSEYTIKIFTATESFSEHYRDYVCEKVKIKNQYTDILNVYGSVELGTMAHETPLAILIRKLAIQNEKLYQDVFGEATLLPTLAQYYPELTYFEEEVGGELLTTGYGSAFPLIRYRHHDKGGVVTYEQMVAICHKHGLDLVELAEREGIVETIFKLPFVYVYERSDFVVVLRGANIYPENIKQALQLESLQDLVTGKFTMKIKERENFDEYLEINVELKKNIQRSSAILKLISDSVNLSLSKMNSEYNYLYNMEGKKVEPEIILFEYANPKYFSQGIKQKWVEK